MEYISMLSGIMIVTYSVYVVIKRIGNGIKGSGCCGGGKSCGANQAATRMDCKCR
ncbi:hypothetical protein [Desulfuribacillus stibiiarsenatis]|uniref:hypothetical protein n=1 Tax=Desulfuribacillus stibiiarsenatis TaxID=1390249 RepID=UPI00159F0FEB|nr:hypothetical protein [Desulfuribacillus stibiiarsenatis]